LLYVKSRQGQILSHDHYDHLDLAAIDALRERVQRYFVPLGVGARLRDARVAPERIQEFDWWQQGRHGEVQVTATPSQHFSGRTLWDRDSTLWASWAIESGGERIFYSGDSGYFPGFSEIGERFGGFDLALMESGAYDDYWPSVHMRPEETVKAFQDLRGKLLYLVHNSTLPRLPHLAGPAGPGGCHRRTREDPAGYARDRRGADDRGGAHERAVVEGASLATA